MLGSVVLGVITGERAMTDLANPIFNNETAAREHLEAIRWPDGPECPHCNGLNCGRIDAGAHRTGLLYCKDCKRQFTVQIGTIFERSHIPLHKWVLAFHLMNASKKGVSAHQLHRMLGITYKSAWFMAHRIRESMKDTDPQPMGGPGGIVQADETYFGHKRGQTRRRARKNKAMSAKRSVVALVSDGKARTFHVARADASTVRRILVENVKRETELHTDESHLYTRVGAEFKAHKHINHSAGVYVRRDGVTTNACENYFSVFKRGMKGVYQHCSEKHLHRYLSEFDFRYNSRDLSDFERTDKALKGAEGKRLTYRRTGNRSHI